MVVFAPLEARRQASIAANPPSRLAAPRPTLATRPFRNDAAERAHFPESATSRPATGQLEPEAEGRIAGGTTPGVSWNFSKIPMFPSELATRPWPLPSAQRLPVHAVGQSDSPSGMYGVAERVSLTSERDLSSIGAARGFAPQVPPMTPQRRLYGQGRLKSPPARHRSANRRSFTAKTCQANNCPVWRLFAPAWR
jgi:hypothetical protein